MSTSLRSIPGEVHANETYLARLKQARVDESVLMDAIEAYARERYVDEDERDDLVEHLTMPPQVELCRKAVLDVVFSVIAATELPTEEAFRAVVDLMAVEEGDNDVKALKHTFLRTMLDNDELGSQVAERMVYVETRIDAG